MRMKRLLSKTPSGFTIITIVVAILILFPLSAMFGDILDAPSDTWVHIRTHLLPDYLGNTIILIVGTAVLAALLGFFSAYFVTFHDFPMRRFFSWALILPLALPSYIAAYVYADMFSYTGTFARALRLMGITQLVDVMSMAGAILIFGLTLYPYVYLMVKSSLQKQSRIYLDNARLLHAGPLKRLMRVIIPLTRPALIGGTLLVILETLNDYGVVRYFGVRVFSYAIFDAWFRLADVASAIRLSGLMLLLVFGIVAAEKLLRGRRRFQAALKSSSIRRMKLSVRSRTLVIGFLSLVLLFGFGIPVLEMIGNLFATWHVLLDVEWLYIIINTLTITIFASALIVFIALMTVNAMRLSKSRWAAVLLKITNLGYAIPGAVIAIAVLIFFVDLDRRLGPLYELFQNDGPALLLTTSLTMLVFAYCLRFIAIAYNSVDSTYEKIGMSYTEAAYTLGHGKWNTLWRIDLPLIRTGLISAFIIVFIDVLKELPLTLVLRPTNYDTVATRVFTYAGDEMIHEASGPSLVIILLSAMMIYYLTHMKRGGKHVS